MKKKSKIKDIFRKARQKLLREDEKLLFLEAEDLATDEIEMSLLSIKDAYDIPTSEIEESVISRRKSRIKRGKVSR